MYDSNSNAFGEKESSPHNIDTPTHPTNTALSKEKGQRDLVDVGWKENNPPNRITHNKIIRMRNHHAFPLLASLAAAALVVLCSMFLSFQTSRNGNANGGLGLVMPAISSMVSSVTDENRRTRQYSMEVASSSSTTASTAATTTPKQKEIIPSAPNKHNNEIPVPAHWNAGGVLVDSLDGIPFLSDSNNIHNRTNDYPPLKLVSQLNFPMRNTFSATWWQSVERLRGLPVQNIRFCEHAQFLVMHGGNGQEYRLTTDWTGFAVEHLSRWWKMLHYDQTKPSRVINAGADPKAVPTAPPAAAGGYQKAYQRVIRNLVHYVVRVLSPMSSRPLPMQVTQQTLVTVAYLPYNSQYHPERARRLTIVNVAATLASLIQYDMGRIVVLADVEDYQFTLTEIWPRVILFLQLVEQQKLTTLHPEDLLAYLETHESEIKIDLEGTITIHSTELQLTSAPTRNYHRLYGHQKMVPRSAVQLMHKALFGAPPADASSNATSLEEWNVFQRKWLGEQSLDSTASRTSRWKYAYLTEPDSILISKRHVLEQIQSHLNKNLVFTPHRLQPVPHEFDFRTTAPGNNDDGIPIDPLPQLYVPAVGNWSTVRPVTDACCDVGYAQDPNLRGGGKCGQFWFACGFGKVSKLEVVEKFRQEAVDRLTRYGPFRMVQFMQGTRLIHLAGSESGRICIPRNVATEGPCPELPRDGLAMEMPA
eukprot:scaffold5478_cov161-Amphora_coffeaeformis.AAC.13